MGWKRDPEKFRRHVEEARTFFTFARGPEPAGLEDLLGRPFLSPDGPPFSYSPDVVRTSSGDDLQTSTGDTQSDFLFRLQQLAQLYESGALTYAEFEAAKERVISGG